jgi:predicted negative regulator of RcsB-dependent stress response
VLKRYLAGSSDNSSDEAQAARYIVATHHVRKKSSAKLNDCAVSSRNMPLPQRAGVQTGGTFASAYREAGQLDRATETARAGLQSVLARKPVKIEERRSRDEALGQVATFLANIHLAQKRPDDAARVLEELRQTALRLPSASVYAEANAHLKD